MPTERSRGLQQAAERLVAGLPPATLRDWVEESYRIVAPKRLVAELDRRAS